jgi:hypothetical protein
VACQSEKLCMGVSCMLRPSSSWMCNPLRVGVNNALLSFELCLSQFDFVCAAKVLASSYWHPIIDDARWVSVKAPLGHPLGDLLP